MRLHESQSLRFWFLFIAFGFWLIVPSKMMMTFVCVYAHSNVCFWQLSAGITESECVCVDSALLSLQSVCVVSTAPWASLSSTKPLIISISVNKSTLTDRPTDQTETCLYCVAVMQNVIDIHAKQRKRHTHATTVHSRSFFRFKSFSTHITLSLSCSKYGLCVAKWHKSQQQQ